MTLFCVCHGEVVAPPPSGWEASTCGDDLVRVIEDSIELFSLALLTV